MDKTTKTVLQGVCAAAVVIAVLILIFQSFYTIKEQEQAVVTTFGVPHAVSEPGLHVKIPFVQQVTKVNTTIKGFAIGYDETTNISREDESLMITSDYNFVNVDFYVEYKVSDPIKALYASEQPVSILKNIAQSCIRSVVGRTTVDSVITTGKGEIQAEIKERIIAELTAQDIGIQLINITIQDAEPPTTEVMEAFKAVETAKQGKETAINNANKYRNEKLPGAEAQIDRILKEAEAKKEARINEAEGQAARFNALYEEYIKYPLITKQRMYYETMEELLPDLKLIIDSGDSSVEKFLPLEPLTGNTVINAVTE
ncbi:MAG: FtsH protease activity modulator HflK [Lachnospiraceae bacterium]|nr:FtsH protease activity modulator HflK [Lachnospiraceae bacterium]